MTVTGRKRTELLDEVRSLQERFEHLSAATAEGVFLHEAGRILDLNRSGAEMFGYLPEELFGRSVVDLSPPEERSLVLARIAAGREGTWETRGLRKDGTVFPVELHTRNVAVGSETLRAVTARDLSERRKAEQELRESQERYRSILENLRAIAYCARASDRRLLFLAGSVSEIAGRDSAELISGTLDWEDLVHPEDRSELREEAARLASGGVASDSTYRIVRPDGTVVWVRDIARTTSVGSEVLFDGLVIDVTPSKATERELRMTRDLLLRTEQLARIGSWSWEPESGRATWSPGMYRHYGLSPGETSSPVDISMRAIHAEDLPRLREHMLAAAKTGRVDPIEYRVVVGGVIRYHRTEGEVQVDGETGSLRMLGFVQDVTALKEMEAERRRLEQERDRLFETSADLLSVAGFDGRFKQLNPAWARTLGWTMEELLSRPWRDFVHPDDLADTIEAGATLQRGESVTSFENRYRHRDGSYRWLSWNSRSLPDAELMFSVARDVTERRRAEEALRESEERYRSLFEGAPYGIYRSTPDGRLVAVNRTLATMLGYEEGELQGRTVGELCLDPVEWNRLVAESRNGKPIQGLEVGWTRKDGAVITVRLSGRPITGDDGLPVGFEMIAEDVSERRLLEEQFRQSQKMEAVGRLAGGIAHDFNNLLTAIAGYADLLRVRLPRDDPRRGYVEEIGAAADRAAALTRQLLAFSRRQLLQPRVVNLEDMVRNVERMLGRIIGEDIELETRLEAKGSVRADVSQLEQVLLNLAVNARDAMPEGGKLLIETADSEVPEGGEIGHPGRGPMPAGSYVCLAVSDTGIGMDRRALSHIFEPFFTTKDAGKGTGLGLATVYGIVKQSEGFIWVSSEPGRGARFEVYLPRVEEAAETPTPAPADNHKGGSETILLVEDEEGVRCIVSEMLEWYGYTVLRATGASEAVHLARAHEGPIHLLLTDVVMPRLSGRALRDEITMYRPRIPVLYISGYAGEHRTRELLKDGAAFLAKPFTAAALAQKVREVLTGTATATDPAPGGALR